MKTNYVLIDYENVQPDAVAALDKEHFKVIVFIGASQAKVSFEFASTLQHMGDRAEYIKISGNGPNALDFHIAFYIGQIAARDPQASFHIISKDSGFDPLIQHLKTLKISCSRSRDVPEPPAAKVANSKSADEKIGTVINDLKRRGASKPRTVKTLSSTINSLFQKQLSDQELKGLLAELQRQGIIIVNDKKVSYSLTT